MPWRFPAYRRCGEKAWEPECDPERQTFLHAWVGPRGPFLVPCSRSISRLTRRREIALRAAWAPPARVVYFAEKAASAVTRLSNPRSRKARDPRHPCDQLLSKTYARMLRLAYLVFCVPGIDIGTAAQSLLAAAGPASILLLATTVSFQVAPGCACAFLFAVSALSHHLGNR